MLEFIIHSKVRFGGVTGSNLSICIHIHICNIDISAYVYTGSPG